MTSKAPASDWKLAIFVPETAAVPFEDDVQPGPNSTLHSKGGLIGFFSRGKEIEVDASTATKQWRQTIDGIINAVSEWGAASAGAWEVREVNFGLTLSAEGKLLFIAKAGAQASIQVKLLRAGK